MIRTVGREQDEAWGVWEGANCSEMRQAIKAIRLWSLWVRAAEAIAVPAPPSSGLLRIAVLVSGWLFFAPAGAAEAANDKCLKPDGSVDWATVNSDEQAIVCLTRMASLAGPARTVDILRADGFDGIITITQRHRPGEVLVSAVWPVSKHGNLYRIPLWRQMIRRFVVHGLTFSIRFYPDNRVFVRMTETIK